MSELQLQLRGLLADRHTPETRAFYERLLTYIERRSRQVWKSCYPDLLSGAQVDEAVAEVLKRLVSGALIRFRGETLNELFAFVRVITDRCIWRSANKVIRERKALDGEGAEAAESWHYAARSPDEVVEHVPHVPLNDADQAFLKALLQAESKVAYSRAHGVSRAAVTQRVQRIRKRIEKLEPKDQRAVDAWLHVEARAHLARDQ